MAPPLPSRLGGAAKTRIRPTESTITPDQLAAIRARIGIALGL